MPCKTRFLIGTKGGIDNMKEVHWRLEDELYGMLKAEAVKRDDSMNEVARRLLRKALAGESANDAMDEVAAVLTKVIRRELKPTEERLAKINAKTSIAAATSMYLNYFVIGYLKGLPTTPKEIWEEARKKALAFLRERYNSDIKEVEN